MILSAPSITLSTARIPIKPSGRFIGFRLRTQFMCFASRFICNDATANSYSCGSNCCVSCLLITFLCVCLLSHMAPFIPFQGIQLFSQRPLSPDNMMYCKLIIYRQLTLKKLFFPDHRKFVFLKTNTDVILSCNTLNIELVVNS